MSKFWRYLTTAPNSHMNGVLALGFPKSKATPAGQKEHKENT